jgi:hypothetical protein
MAFIKKKKKKERKGRKDQKTVCANAIYRDEPPTEAKYHLSHTKSPLKDLLKLCARESFGQRRA